MCSLMLSKIWCILKWLFLILRLYSFHLHFFYTNSPGVFCFFMYHQISCFQISKTISSILLAVFIFQKLSRFLKDELEKYEMSVKYTAKSWILRKKQHNHGTSSVPIPAGIKDHRLKLRVFTIEIHSSTGDFDDFAGWDNVSWQTKTN